MMLRLFAKNNNLQYVDPTDAEIALTYDFYYEYLKKMSSKFIIIALLTLLLPLYSIVTVIMHGYGFIDAVLWSLLVIALDTWLIICAIKYRQYIANIKNGRFQLAYVQVKRVGMHTISTRRHRTEAGCLWYEAQNKQGEVITWTARLPDKIAKELQYSKIQKGFVISLEKQMEGMGVVISSNI